MQQLVPLRVRVAAALAGLLIIGLICGVTFAQSQPPTFRTGTGIIEVEVTVLDTNGVPVPDLTSSEFQVFEDDVLQNIVSFSFNTVGQSPIRQSVGVANATVGDRVNDSHSGNTFVLLLDSGFPERVRLVASEFIDSGVRPGDRVAIINRGGEVPPTLPFTSDRSEMMAQISRKAERVQPSPTIDRSYRLLRDIAARLAVLPGRGKAIVFIGSGTHLLWNRRVDGKEMEAARQTKRAFENAMRMATLANIPIHAVDPSGLAPAVTAESLIRLTTVDPIRQLEARQLPGPETDREDQQSSVRLMAEITGGLDLVNTNNWKGNFARATLQRGPTYVLTYASSANQRDGKFHSIRVAVSRPGLTVRSKQGYYAFREGGSITPAVPLPRNLSRAARTALEDDIPRPGISLSLSAAAFNVERIGLSPAERRGTSVLVSIDVHLKTTQVNLRNPLELAWAALDDDGAIRAADRMVVDLRAVRNESLSVFKRLALIPGQYRITATATQEKGAVGSASVWVDSSDSLTPALLFSDIVVVSSKLEVRHVIAADEAIKRVLPSMPTQRRIFGRDETLTLFVELDDGIQAAERGFAIRSRLTSSGGRIVWKDDGYVKAKATRGAKVEYKPQIPLRTMEPDDYVLTIEAVDADGSVLSNSRMFAFIVQ